MVGWARSCYCRSTSMKFLLVSDLHYTLKQFDWLDHVAPQFDLMVLAGDHLDISSSVTLDAQIVVVLQYLRRLKAKTQLIVSSGNHDLNARNAEGEKVARWMSRVRQLGIPVDGESLVLDDTTFTICPWWDGPQARAGVDAQLARDAEYRSRRWVWIYHAPPEASPVSWAGTRHYGDADLVTWIHRHAPDMVLTGHIHQAPFRAGGSWFDKLEQTWVFNAGRQIGPVPTHVIFDTDAPSAAWFSLAGDEEIRLDEPLVRSLA